MKKIISVILAMCVGLTVFAGCGNAAGDKENSDKVSIVATIFAPYDFARQIAGDKADVKMLLPPGSESHSYEPTPQDIITVQNCDVFIYVGGDSDEWVADILSSMDMKDKQVVTLMDCVETVEEEVVEGMQEEEHDHGDEHAGDEHATNEHADEEHTDEHATEEHTDEHATEEEHTDEEHELDEHVWTSPRNAKLITQKISDAIQAEDAANTDIYKQNTTDYLEKLDELDNKFKDVVANGTRKEIVMGDRFPFRYFADAYGLTYSAAFVGCSTETDASAATIAFLIDKTVEKNLPVVFHIELSNEKIANTIAEGAKEKNGGKDVKVLLLHACHNVTKSDFEGGATYISLMEKNVTTLKEALA